MSVERLGSPWSLSQTAYLPEQLRSHRVTISLVGTVHNELTAAVPLYRAPYWLLFSCKYPLSAAVLEGREPVAIYYAKYPLESNCRKRRHCRWQNQPINLLFICFCLPTTQGAETAHAFPLRHTAIFIGMEGIYMYRNVLLFDSFSGTFSKIRDGLRSFIFHAPFLLFHLFLFCFNCCRGFPLRSY